MAKTYTLPTLRKPTAPAPMPDYPTNDTPHPLLLSILSTKRSHGSVGDYLFRGWLLNHLVLRKPMIVGDGNIVVQVGASTVAFSSHIDTCHGENESDGTAQSINTDMGLITLADKSRCLGADDGVGVFLMLQMIGANVPGTYIFHTGEECGGTGSVSIRDCEGWLLKHFDLIVAFDRAVHPGSAPEVITQQGGKVCASDTTGQALADALNAAVPALGYVVSHGGSFTDTRNYTNDVAECFNLGCFYCDQHGPGEFVDIAGVNNLLQAVLTIDWQALPIHRDPRPAKPIKGQGVYEKRYGASSNNLAMPQWMSGSSNRWADDDLATYDPTFDEEEDPLDDSEWLTLAEAVEAAMETGSQLVLKDVVAEMVAPESTAIARKMMTQRIADSDLVAAYDALYGGEEPTVVANDLFQSCSPV